MATQGQSADPLKGDHYWSEADATVIDWSNYLFARPDYNKSSFYDMLYDYHSRHGGEWGTAYDIGCGPGQVAAELATRFARVRGSDRSEHIVETARRAYHDRPNLAFETCLAEDAAKPAVGDTEDRVSSADLVTVAECIPILDTAAAMNAFATLLQPGGTLAVWFYGGPIYVAPEEGGADPACVAAVEALHRTITDRSLDEFRPFAGTSWEQGHTKVSTSLDCIEFDPALWRDVHRIKWNTEDRTMNFTDEDTLDFEYKYTSAIHEGEKVETRRDPSFWGNKDIDYRWSKGFIDSNMPRSRDYVTPEVQGMLDELKEKMEGKKWDIAWPAVLLLATRK